MAHPTRLRLVGLLRLRGPLTATQAGQLIGESSGSCSFHLRQLAKYGLVEEAGGGRGREKPWRATADYTSWSANPENPDAAEPTRLLRSMIAQRYEQKVRDWAEALSREAPRWREAAVSGDSLLYATADELEALGRSVEELLRPFVDRLSRPDLRPPGARPVAYLQLGYPITLDPMETDVAR